MGLRDANASKNFATTQSITRIESFKKSRATATLLLSIFANIDKSNVAVERLFLKLSMDPLVGNDCPISIFSGLGGHGLSFFDFGQ